MSFGETPLTVGQIIDALSLCDDRELPVRAFDLDSEKGFSIVFVEQANSYDGGHMVYLHRHKPNLDNIACEPIKQVSDRSSTFAKVEYEGFDE